MNRFLSRHIGLPLQITAAHGGPGAWPRFLSRYRENLELERAPAGEQRARQLVMLRELLVHAGKNVPWYRRVFRENGFRPEMVDSLERLRDLPPLTKEDIQDNLPELASAGGGSLGAFLNSTGGSTGLPLNFYQGRRYVSESSPNAWVSDGAAGRRLGDRACVLWAARRDIPLPGRMKNRLWNALINRRFLNAYAMSPGAMEDFASLVERFRPRVLIGYAESLDIFARFLLTRGSGFTFPGVSVISTAGMLYPDMREVMEEVFEVPILDRYGCREVGLLAYECIRHSGYHLNVFNQVVELEEPGSSEPSPVLATNLSNYSMPFIRYRTGDLAVPGDCSPCPCGRTSPRFSRLVGRMTDTVTTAEGKMIYGAYFRHVLFGVMGLRRFQFIQESTALYRLLLETTPLFDAAELTGIRERILDAVGVASKLEISLVESIEPSPSGKHLFVISKVPVDRSQSARER